jgi:hypothetical protein
MEEDEDDGGTSLGKGKCIRATERAILVKLEKGKEIWIPKRNVHDNSEVYEVGEEGNEGNVIVKTWWAEQEELA